MFYSTFLLRRAQPDPEKRPHLGLVSSKDDLDPAPKPVFRLTVEVTANFRTGERAGRETYRLTRDQLNELASHARRLEAARV